MMNVLIADDNAFNHLILESYFRKNKKYKFKIDKVFDGK